MNKGAVAVTRREVLSEMVHRTRTTLDGIEAMLSLADAAVERDVRSLYDEATRALCRLTVLARKDEMRLFEETVER